MEKQMFIYARITLNSNLNATNDYLDFKNLSIKYINSDLSGDLNKKITNSYF